MADAGANFNSRQTTFTIEMVYGKRKPFKRCLHLAPAADIPGWRLLFGSWGTSTARPSKSSRCLHTLRSLGVLAVIVNQIILRLEAVAFRCRRRDGQSLAHSLGSGRLGHIGEHLGYTKGRKPPHFKEKKGEEKQKE